MFVFTAKVSKSKIAAIATLLIAVVVVVAIVIAARSDGPKRSASGDTNEERVLFLAQYGWEVNAEPVQTQSVTVPEKTSEIFARYNALQLSQGFDLTKYAGKTATRYVYEILNYPDATEPVYATVFVYDGSIIGGDVTDTAPQGLMHGFSLPQH